MKNALFKTLATAAVATLLASANLAAQQADWNHQERPAGPPSAEQQLARLSENLGLRDDQSMRLLEVLQSARADHEALHERMMEDYGAELCAQRERIRERILAVLDPEQAVLFKQQQRARLRDRGAGGRQPLNCDAYGG